MPLTKRQWQNEIDYLLDVYIPQRRDIVVQQLKKKKLYPDIEPPQFFLDDAETDGSMHEITGTAMIKITNPNSAGILFYTLDGRDPRETGGGAVSAAAKSQAPGNGDITIQLSGTTILKARVKHNKEWSALQEAAFFLAEEDYQGLVISEIHYHPEDQGDIDGDEYEFLELYNAGDTPVNLTAARFTQGISFTFPAKILLPGECAVIVKNYRAFIKLYGTGIPVTGSYKGNLANNGETIALTSPSGRTIFEVTYDDKDPWPASADGKGFSLKIKDPALSLNDGKNWVPGRQKQGSPGGTS
jgi:hypothetical protein